MFFFVNLALFFNNYVNPVALDEISWKYYIVYCCWLAFELVVVYFVSFPPTSTRKQVLTRGEKKIQLFVETRYTPLEEIAKYFDGDEARIGGEAATGLAKETLEALHEKGRITSNHDILDKVTSNQSYHEKA